MLFTPSARFLKLAALLSGVFVLTTSVQADEDESADDSLNSKVRQLIDTIGFAQYSWQIDSIFARMPAEDKQTAEDVYKTVICPHDDYAYAAGLYNKTLSGIKAKTVILIGVAHKARNFGLENKLVFDSFDAWRCVYGNIGISPLRDELIRMLPENSYVVHDSMMQLEHSLEAVTPFLQKNNHSVEILPILVPYMTFENMLEFSGKLAEQVQRLMQKAHLSFGKDVAIVISNDAVHYGDVDWGGSDLAPFGTDSVGTEKAMQKDRDIIDQCLKGEGSAARIRAFYNYTVKTEDFRAYNWVWCGRYSVPFGLLFANELNKLFNGSSLNGELIEYRNSLRNSHIDVMDLGMGVTAPANQRHWVAYVGMGYD